MQLTFLQAAVPLTKKYTKRSDGSYEKSSYPSVFRVTSLVEEVSTIEEFAAALDKHAALGNCLHTGSTDRPLIDESRAKHHNRDEPRQWIMLDLDDIDYPSTEAFISDLPATFHDVSYIAQHSPSSGIKSSLNMHLFFLLDKPEDMKVVSDWIKYTNLVTGSLRNQITLTASDKGLRFKLDVVANANGRVIYIAHPECIGFEDPVKTRIEVIKKSHDELRHSFVSTSPSELKLEYRKAVDDIRASSGLDKLRAKELYETRGEIEVLRKGHTNRGRIHDAVEDSSIIMRCNIDGGDSHAYFYYIKYPQYIRNHKGEPALRMAELDPDYYTKIAEPRARIEWEKDRQPFVFRNKANDKYYAGLRLGADIIEQPNVIGSDAKIQDYFTEHGGLGVPSPYPTWSIRFDPRLKEQWNEDRKVFNTWRQSDIMKQAVYRTLPPVTITRIIEHALGNDPEAYHHFINWLAYIYQYRAKTGTAWVLHGVQGTGKGLIIDHVLTPIFGHDYVVKQQSRNLKSEFNGFMERALIVNLDEFDIIDAGSDATGVTQALKMWITDKRMPIRAMYTESSQVDNFSNFVLTTNSKSAMPIDEGDRRFSFGVRQETRLAITPEEVELIPTELLDFAGYLGGYEVDRQLAHTCLENDTKAQAKRLSRTSIEEFVDAVRDGDLQFFLDATHEQTDFQLADRYRHLLDSWISNAKKNKVSCVSSHDLLTAYQVICREDKQMKSIKFKKMMEHKSLPSKRVTDSDNNRRIGWRVEWNIDQETLVNIGGHIKSAGSSETLKKKVQKEIASSD